MDQILLHNNAGMVATRMASSHRRQQQQQQQQFSKSERTYMFAGAEQLCG